MMINEEKEEEKYLFKNCCNVFLFWLFKLLVPNI